MRLPRPGHSFVLGDDGSPYEVPNSLLPAGFAYQAQNAYPPALSGLGQHPQDHNDQYLPAELRGRFTFIPAFYTVSIILPGDVTGQTINGATALRPEAFLCKRVTWATTGDTPAFITSPGGQCGSAQGRSVTIQWSDEFTKFLGEQPALISAILGDSQGFLDIPSGVLFQGKQSLTAGVQRLLWPDPESTPADVRFDIVFHGLGLLPKGIHQSGSAG